MTHENLHTNLIKCAKTFQDIGIYIFIKNAKTSKLILRNSFLFL